MSRFFATGDTESSASESDGEGDYQAPTIAPKAGNFIDSDSDDERRVVVMRSDKRKDELQRLAKAYRGYKKNRDFERIDIAFADLQTAVKAYQKATGTDSALPSIFLQTVLDMSAFVGESWGTRKTLNKLPAKALSSLKQNVKKLIEANQEAFDKFKENPVDDDEEEAKKHGGGESDEDDDDQFGDDDEFDDDGSDPFAADSDGFETVGRKKKTSKKKSQSDDDASDSDDDEDDRNPKSKFLKDDFSESESDSDEEVPTGNLTREWFLKTTVEREERERKERQQERARLRKERREAAEAAGREARALAGEDGPGGAGEAGSTVEQGLFEGVEEITAVMVLEKLEEILAARGRKGTVAEHQVDLLQKLAVIATEQQLGRGIETKLHLHVISALFFQSTPTNPMNGAQWNRCFDNISALIRTLTEHTDVHLVDTTEIPQAPLGSDPSATAPPTPTTPASVSSSSGAPAFPAASVVVEESLLEAPFYVHGSLVYSLERLDDEFTKTLQNTDPHTTEYVSRLREESRLLDLFVLAQTYLEQQGDTTAICRCYLRRLEHLYFKVDYESIGIDVTGVIAAATGGDEETLEVDTSALNNYHRPSPATIDHLCRYIYTHDGSYRMRTRAILCQIYHHALHDRWTEGRDLMLMSHLQEDIGRADVNTQALFNRAMVQLGLCAFRNGLIKDAHASLHEIMATQKAKELLAQGVQNPRHQDKTAEEEKIEKRRQLPFHMHINYELLECVYLTTALLIEVPNMAANRFDHRRRIVSKPFRKYWDIIERQLFQGPPENTREHVIAAARALHNGDWRQCHKYLMDIKAWNLFPAADTVKTMLRSEVQTQGIRTYLLEYSGAYASLHIDDLCAMFELERPAVHAIVSKMIINEELHATWDQPTNTVLIHQEEPSRLQALAVQFADKAAQLVENNDRLYEVRVGASAQQQTQRNTGSSGGSGGNSGGGGNSSGSGYYRKDSQLRNRSTQGGQQRGGNYRSYSNAGGNSSTGNADYSRNYAR